MAVIYVFPFEGVLLLSAKGLLACASCRRLWTRQITSVHVRLWVPAGARSRLRGTDFSLRARLALVSRSATVVVSGDLPLYGCGQLAQPDFNVSLGRRRTTQKLLLAFMVVLLLPTFVVAQQSSHKPTKPKSSALRSDERDPLCAIRCRLCPGREHDDLHEDRWGELERGDQTVCALVGGDARRAAVTLANTWPRCWVHLPSRFAGDNKQVRRSIYQRLVRSSLGSMGQRRRPI